MILPERATNRSASEFIVEAGRLFQSFERLLRIGQGIENRVALCAIDRTVDVVGSRLGDDVDNRTGVASIFWAEVTCGDLIFRDEFGVGYGQAWAGNGIVVVVLSVDLLVVVASPETIDSKARAVGIGEAQVAVIHHPGHGQRQIVQPLVLQDAGKSRNISGRERIRDLRLRTLNQWL